ncbi:beta-lactamase family protein [candidate division KSB1 bacterium]|nr:beta-lactamase family protein [candidate division KSB1 bacterium]
MRTIFSQSLLFLTILSLTRLGTGLPISQEQTKSPVFDAKNNTFIREWLVAGPFPNPVTPEALPDGGYNYGYYTDFLESIGGENRAELKENMEIRYKDENDEFHTVRTIPVSAQRNGVINLDATFNQTDRMVAYGFCYIRSESKQQVGFLLGSDDGVKVWLNGRLVFQNDVARSLIQDQDRFETRLEPGLNTLLVKVDDKINEWGYVIRLLEETVFKNYLAEQQAKKDFDRFLNCRLVPKEENTWNFVFSPGPFPEMGWEKPYLVEKVLGFFPLEIRWYDAQLNNVEKAEAPGRYIYYAEGAMKDGIKIRRAGTLYCMPADWLAWGERPQADLRYLPLDFIDKQVWNNHMKPISYYSGRTVLLSILNQQEGAVLLSYLDDVKNTDGPPKLTDTPVIHDHDYHLALKRKILKIENKWPSLKMPQKTSNSRSPVLHPGTEKEAGIVPGTADKIRAVCEQWYKESEEPFITLVARKGVIVIHDVFGQWPDGGLTMETSTEMASLTKLITGLLFAQFIDQGLVNIDDPVGKFLPDFPTEGEKAVTLRHCFTHTSGLWGHEEWGGMHNPWLDNVIASMVPRLQVGVKHEYNGMGYDLAGKVMEMVSGKSIFRLFRENFFDPLELKNTILEEDLGFSCFSNAGEFAVFGQLLLNRGSYGDLYFFSPQTFEKLLPQPLDSYYPNIHQDWGIGLTWMRQTHPDAGKDGLAEDRTILSKNVIGHGSATSAILRVDLDNNLVICQTRRRAGKSYDQYLEKFLKTIADGIE